MSARPVPLWAALTDTGRVRAHNEDSVLAEPPLFVVADGLGGHEAGEIASQIAVETLRDHAPRRADAPALARAVKAANKEVLRAAKEGVGRAGMGTTLTAAIVEGDRIAIAHVGDSRAYLLTGGQLRQITGDHSMVADMMRRGQITEADARIHPNRSVITRALGTDAEMFADPFEIEAHTGDRLLLCSDGLTGMLDDARIAETLRAHRNPADAAAELIAAANGAGGHDNISVVIVDIESTGKDSRGVRASDSVTRGWVAAILWVLVALAIIGASVYGTYLYAQRRAFVVRQGDVVAVYRGVPGELAGIELRWLADTVVVDTTVLSLGDRTRLDQGVAFDSLEAALEYARSLETSSSPAE